MIQIRNLTKGIVLLAEELNFTLTYIMVDDKFLKFTYETDMPDRDMDLLDIYGAHKNVKQIRCLTRQIPSGFRTAMMVEFEPED